MRIAVRVLVMALLAAGMWRTLGAGARLYGRKRPVEPGEKLYTGEIAPTLKDHVSAATGGLVMLVLGGVLFAKSKARAK